MSSTLVSVVFPSYASRVHKSFICFDLMLVCEVAVAQPHGGLPSVSQFRCGIPRSSSHLWKMSKHRFSKLQHLATIRTFHCTTERGLHVVPGETSRSQAAYRTIHFISALSVVGLYCVRSCSVANIMHCSVGMCVKSCFIFSDTEGSHGAGIIPVPASAGILSSSTGPPNNWPHDCLFAVGQILLLKLNACFLILLQSVGSYALILGILQSFNWYTRILQSFSSYASILWSVSSHTRSL